MSTAALLAELRSNGVELSVEGDQLRCRAPKGALSPELLARIRENKPAIVEALREAVLDGPMTVTPLDGAIERAASREPLPLSLSQQRLWFVDSLRPGTALLNLPCAFRLLGPLDIDAYTRVIDTIVGRHDVLRTVIKNGSEGVEQVVLPMVPVSLNVIDKSEEPGAREPARARAILLEEFSRPFSLDEGPLFRCGLLRCGPQDHIGYFVANHLVWDGWSFDVFFHELRALYASLSQGEPSPLPPLAIQYGDYVLWHRRWLESAPRKAQLEYWKKKLTGLAVLELPLDHPRPPVMSYRGTTFPFSIPPHLVQRLRDLGRRRGATLYMVLLAALKVLLHLYTGQRDLVIGAPVEGRARPETEDLIGLFVNTLLLRTELDPAASFAELLERVKDTCVEAYDHQHTPFEQLVDALRPARNRNRTPLFQVMFSYQQVKDRGAEMGALCLEQFHVHAGNAGTDITFWVKDDGVQVFGAFEYATDLFDRDTIFHMASSMVELFEAVTANPEAALDGLDFLRSQREALDRFNATDASFPREALVHRLIEAQVDCTPDAVAVRFEGESMSYRELDARANQLARRLRALAVGPDTLVALCLRRSTELVVALLAIHKAGGAYVPLDPAYPRERLAYMLADSGAPVLVCESATSELFEEPSVQRVLVDIERDSLAKESAERLLERESPDQLAYAIYTSGSTGKPKGVLIEHRNVVSFMKGMEERLDLSPGGVWLALTSISFDISVLEIFGSLTHGITVVLLGDQRLGDAAETEHSIPRLIERWGVTHLQCTPSQMSLLLAQPEARAAVSRVRQVLVGGEALPSALAAELLSISGGDVINMYGPTETTVWSTTHRVTETAGSVPIGRPIANTRLYVLDAQRRRTPIGVPGELYIGGDGVVRGYHRRSELTEERFLPDPFRECGHRMYRTGDLVRVRADGVVEFLGRNDFQVKVRGYRIELGEVEGALVGHPSVSDAVVVAQDDFRGDKRLIAYVVPTNGAVSQDALREHLKRELAPFMVPSAFIPLAAFPLTPNGKVDRRALPAPDASREPERAHVAPRDAVEAALVRIWQDALGLRAISVHDDFFDLGGHSLLGVRLLLRLHTEFGVRLSLAALFEAPTVAALAALVRREQGGAVPTEGPAVLALPVWSTVVPVQPQGSLPPFFCAAGKGGNPMNLIHVARHMGPEQPFYGLQHRGVDGRLEPHGSIEEMAQEFVSDIRRVQPFGPYYIGGFSGGGVAAFEVAQQLRRAGEEVGALVLLESANPLLAPLTLRERGLYHVGRLRGEGPSYVAVALRGRLGRMVERARLIVLSQAAKLKPYEFRHEAVISAWIQAARRYRPVGYPGRVVLLRSRIRDTGVFDAYNGWLPVVEGEFEVFDVNGTHVSFVGPQHAAETARQLALALARARAALNVFDVVRPESHRREGAMSSQWVSAE